MLYEVTINCPLYINIVHLFLDTIIISHTWSTDPIEKVLFWVKQICAGFFYCLIMYVLPLNIQLSRGGIPITSLTLSHFCACPSLDFHQYILCFFLVHWLKVRVGCTINWYLWNCCPLWMNVFFMFNEFTW